LDPQSREDRATPSRRTLWLIVVPIIVLVIASNVGDALAPTLVDRHPLLLIMLNARNRNLVLVTNSVDAVPYYVVGTLRLLISDPLFYLLGWFYGDAAVRWMERKAPTYGRFMRAAEKYFALAAYPLIFIAPNNYICLFAGAAGMPLVAFFVVNISGTITRLYLLRVVGDIFEGPIQSVLDFIKDYRIPLLIITVAIVLVSVWNEHRLGKGEITSLTHLEEELEEIGAEEAQASEEANRAEERTAVDETKAADE
jgi:membrane protein DedA with SNARE-associated domain